MRHQFRHRLVAIGIGSVSVGVLGALIAVNSSDLPTRFIGWSLLAGTIVAIGFWAVRLATFPVAERRIQLWLIGCYVVGVCSLLAGLFASVWGIAIGVGGEPLYWLSVLLLIIEVGEHFGFRWVDGQGRWGLRRRLGGATWSALRRSKRLIKRRSMKQGG